MKESSAKQNEKESTWGFEVPRPDLRRISIDLRPNIHQQGNYSHTFRPSPGLDERPELQQLPPNYIIPFVSETPGRYRYHGGPIVDKSSCKWRATYLTRACGEIIGIEALNLPLPTHMSKIVRSVAVMASPRTCQSAIWIGPRLLLSTLHLQDWIQGYPSDVQCEHVRRSGMSFAVESEICSQFLSLESSKVQLVQFNTRAEIGIFKLQDGYLSSPDWVDIDWLMEGDEASSLNEGCQAACIAYNGRVTRQDEKEIKKQAWSRLQQNLPKSAFSFTEIDLEVVAKPKMRSFAPGTLDKAIPGGQCTAFGVSSTVWKGASGGPCVLLDGPTSGKIIGLIEDPQLKSDPYNLVKGFPTGLKAALRGL